MLKNKIFENQYWALFFIGSFSTSLRPFYHSQIVSNRKAKNVLKKEMKLFWKLQNFLLKDSHNIRSFSRKIKIGLLSTFKFVWTSTLTNISSIYCERKLNIDHWFSVLFPILRSLAIRFLLRSSKSRCEFF